MDISKTEMGKLWQAAEDRVRVIEAENARLRALLESEARAAFQAGAAWGGSSYVRTGYPDLARDPDEDAYIEQRREAWEEK